MDQLIDQVEAGLDPEHRALYAPHFTGERQLVAKIGKNAKPPECVAATVERQLTRRRMRPPTLVGADARSILVMKALLPTAASTRSGVRASTSRSRHDEQVQETEEERPGLAAPCSPGVPRFRIRFEKPSPTCETWWAILGLNQ
jgi:hypothetical protein